MRFIKGRFILIVLLKDLKSLRFFSIGSLLELFKNHFVGRTINALDVINCIVPSPVDMDESSEFILETLYNYIRQLSVEGEQYLFYHVIKIIM
jgi:hypothetical protein